MKMKMAPKSLSNFKELLPAARSSIQKFHNVYDVIFKFKM